MSATNEYWVDTGITLHATFTDDDGNLADPTTVTGKVKEPDDATTTVTATRISTGVYEGPFLITKAGWHTFSYQGSGAVKAYSERRFFAKARTIA